LKSSIHKVDLGECTGLKCDIVNCTDNGTEVNSTDYEKFSTCVNNNYNNNIYNVSRGGQSCRYSTKCEFDINNNNVCTCGNYDTNLKLYINSIKIIWWFIFIFLLLISIFYISSFFGFMYIYRNKVTLEIEEEDQLLKEEIAEQKLNNEENDDEFNEGNDVLNPTNRSNIDEPEMKEYNNDMNEIKSNARKTLNNNTINNDKNSY